MLKQTIQTDIKEAMKAHDELLLTVLRGAIAAMNAKQAEKRYVLAKADTSKTEEVLLAESALNDDEAIGVIASEIKKRRDAIALYQEGGRAELAEGEKKEIAMLQKYLPEQLGADEIKKLVAEAIAVTGAADIKDMGKVMAELSPKIKGKAEGGEVSKIVKELLSK